MGLASREQSPLSQGGQATNSLTSSAASTVPLTGAPVSPRSQPSPPSQGTRSPPGQSPHPPAWGALVSPRAQPSPPSWGPWSPLGHSPHPPARGPGLPQGRALTPQSGEPVSPRTQPSPPSQGTRSPPGHSPHPPARGPGLPQGRALTPHLGALVSPSAQPSPWPPSFLGCVQCGLWALRPRILPQVAISFLPAKSPSLTCKAGKY